MWHPDDHSDDRAVGLAMLGIVVFSLLTGLGIGAFVEEPLAGGIGGAVVGIVAGVLLAPALGRQR